jgi:hypothetical protein
MSVLKYKNEDYTLKVPNDTVVGKSKSYPAFRFRLEEIDKNDLKGENLVCLISTTSVFDKSLLRTYRHIDFYKELTNLLAIDTSKYVDPHYFLILDSEVNYSDVISDIKDNL